MTEDNWMTAEDIALHRKVLSVDDPVTAAQFMREYYRDAGRADRTPRELMYYDLGLLTGFVMRLSAVHDRSRPRES